MVRQFKIHTNLDGTDDKVCDVTNGKVRFYQPSNLGLQSTNNIWQSNGIGVMGARSIKQPQIEFKLETFGESLEENYQLMKDFVNDILSKKFVTLEYQTEIFQVYADLALSEVTKTEGYGKNGTFSEKITFDVITKWYTYENLTFDKIQNGKVIAGKSKIYGGTAPGSYKYIKGVSYTYYGETNIERLSRWDIKDEIFSFMGILYPQLPKTPAGVRFLDDIGTKTAHLKPEQLIESLHRQQNQADFAEIFEQTLNQIAIDNNAIFSVHTDGGTDIRLFDQRLITDTISDTSKRNEVAASIINLLARVKFDQQIFSQGFDFFSTLFEYMIKDYNKDGGGKYAEYYTPHSVAKIIAAILVGNDQPSNIKIYDPSAGEDVIIVTRGENAVFNRVLKLPQSQKTTNWCAA